MPYDPYTDEQNPYDNPELRQAIAALQGPPPALSFDPSYQGYQGPDLMTPTGLPTFQGLTPSGTAGSPDYSQGQYGLRAALAGGPGTTVDWNSPGAPGAPIPESDLSKAATIRGMLEPGPLEKRYLDALAGGPKEVHGFKAHLLGALKGLALGASMGNGLGGIGGAIYGAADPNLVNRALYRIKASAYAEPADVERKSRDDRLKRAAELANLTGIDPITGARTPMAAYRDYATQLATGRLGVQQANSQSLIKSREILNQRRNDATAQQKRRIDIQAFNAEINALTKSGTTPSQETLNAIAEKYPDMVVPPGFDPTKYRVGTDAAGNEMLIPISGTNAGQAKGVTTESGAPMKSLAGAKEERQKAQGEERLRQGREGLKLRAQALSDAENARADKSDADLEKEIRTKEIPPPILGFRGKGTTPEEKKADAQRQEAEYEAKVQDAIQKRRAERDALRTRRQQAQAAPAAPALTRATPLDQITEGAIFTLNGKTVRITFKMPNGQPIPNGRFRPVPVTQ